MGNANAGGSIVVHAPHAVHRAVWQSRDLSRWLDCRVGKHFSEADDRAARDPEKLKQMQRLFDSGGRPPANLRSVRV
jgi:hypothetical protein